MTTTVERSHGSEAFIKDYMHGYLEGSCYLLAVAIHRGTGWPIWGLVKDGVAEHAAIKTPDGRFIDGRGYIPEEILHLPFDRKMDFLLEEVSEAQLLGVKPFTELDITLTLQKAEAAWPELPWRDPFVRKIEAFADELEELSRKHGFWVRGPNPGTHPYLSVGDGGEDGYTLYQTDDATGWTIARRLK